MSTSLQQPLPAGCRGITAAAWLFPARTRTAAFWLVLCIAIMLVPGPDVGQVRIVLPQGQVPGSRIVPDAHNCYPYGGRWSDRIDRALAGGVPVAIEQDLYWYHPANGGPARSVLSHTPPLTGSEPGMESYFFDRVRPIVLAALHNKDHSGWPLITLNLDIKTEEPEHLRAILALLRSHRDWLTTATKTADDAPVALAVGPILVLNGPSDLQQQIFYDELPVGGEIVTFGAVKLADTNLSDPPGKIEPADATNYRRWWNNPWKFIESSGQQKAGPWTAKSHSRLEAFVATAHRHHLWIRFYTLDGATASDQAAKGWSAGYNFPSRQAVLARWRACVQAGVDYIASDEYEQLAWLVKELHAKKMNTEPVSGDTSRFASRSGSVPVRPG